MQNSHVTITYCVGCNWLLRAGWMAQEILQTFQGDLHGVTLVPDETGGVFTISVDDVLIWDRKRDGVFPDAKPLKTRIRDEILPGKELGHLNKRGERPDSNTPKKHPKER